MLAAVCREGSLFSSCGGGEAASSLPLDEDNAAQVTRPSARNMSDLQNLSSSQGTPFAGSERFTDAGHFGRTAADDWARLGFESGQESPVEADSGTAAVGGAGHPSVRVCPGDSPPPVESMTLGASVPGSCLSGSGGGTLRTGASRIVHFCESEDPPSQSQSAVSHGGGASGAATRSAPSF